MAEMVADMRNRFLVALLFAIPISLYSPMGRDMLGFTAAAPFGMRDEVFTLLLSLPVRKRVRSVTSRRDFRSA